MKPATVTRGDVQRLLLEVVSAVRMALESHLKSKGWQYSVLERTSPFRAELKKTWGHER